MYTLRYGDGLNSDSSHVTLEFIYIYIYIPQTTIHGRGSTHGVEVNVLGCDILVSKFELQSCSEVPFGQLSLKKA